MLALPLVLLLAAAPAVPMDVLADVASALSLGDPVAFMRPFDPAMPGYHRLQADVSGLLARADVLSSVELLGDEGDSTHRTVKVDWFLQIRDKQDNGNLERRRQTVTCRFELRGKKWILASLEPLELFKP